MRVLTEASCHHKVVMNLHPFQPSLFLAYSFLTIISVTLGDSNETDLPMVTSPWPPTVTPSKSCLDAKTACENDTDCYHRLFYSHTTCVSGACKPQCKTAILRLYETKLGRQLLHSDFSCLGIIMNSVINCQLDPRGPVLHCTLSKLTCELDDGCSGHFDQLENKCEKKTDPLVMCAPACAQSLFALFNHSIGQSLANCTCWPDDDALCRHMKDSLIDSCKPEALILLQSNRPSISPVTMAADQAESTANDFRNSNVIPVTKKLKESDRGGTNGGKKQFCNSWVMIVILLGFSWRH